MTLNVDNVQKNINTQKREMYKAEHGDIKNIFPQFVSNSGETTSISEAMGGYFDGRIGSTMQSFETGDCWLLTGVNSLNSTKWGKEIIKNAINSDGKGGAVVTLKGAKKENKEFHITVNDVIAAKINEKYSAGDDDMLVIELAVEKYAKELITSGKLDKPEDVAITGGIGISSVELLTGSKTHKFPEKDRFMDKALEKIYDNPGDYAVYCSFIDNKDDMYNNHAYTIKKIGIDLDGNKSAILINPWDSSEEIVIPYDKFRANLKYLAVNEDPKHPDKDLKSEFEVITDTLIGYKESSLIARKITNSLHKGDDKSLQDNMNKITRDNVMPLMEKGSMKNIIKQLDDYKSGWGNGKAKKNLILPLINALAEKAELEHVDKNVIAEFLKICVNQELDAFLYTDADVITEQTKKIIKLIKEKE